MWSPHMSSAAVLEVALFQIHPGEMAAFESAIGQAFQYLQQTEGYIAHQLHHCLESEQTYMLLIHWDSLQAHLVTFRQSENYVQWRALISPYFAEPPQVMHYRSVQLG